MSHTVSVFLPEREVPGKRLGRHVDHDPRSRSFSAARADSRASVRHSSQHLPLDQEAHTCSTAHALCAALNADPIGGSRGALTESLAVEVYEVARSIQSTREDWKPSAGSSALMACKAARKMGLIKGYRHAFGIDHALDALALVPVMSGFNWYESFDDPDARGLVEIKDDAAIRGGHEVLANEIDTANELVWFWNSWGSSYGADGRFCMSFETWERLLGEQGDATVPLVG